MQKLTVKTSSGSKEIPVTAVLTLGAGPGNTVRLPYPQVEPEHARICKTGPYVFIEKLSGGKVLVNSAEISRRALKPGDVIGIGPVVLHFEDDGKPEPAKAPAVKPASDAGSAAPQSAQSFQPAAPVSGTAQSPARPQSAARMQPASKPRISTVAYKDSIRQLSSAAVRSSDLPPAASNMRRWGLLVLGLIVVLIVGFVLTVFGKVIKPAAPDEDRELTAALERLKKSGPKNPDDLVIAKDPLMKAKMWSDVERLLGPCNRRYKDKVMVWQLATGTYDETGNDLRGFEVQPPPGETAGDITPVLIFDVDKSERVRLLGTKLVSKIVIQARPDLASPSMNSPNGSSGMPQGMPPSGMPPSEMPPSGMPPQRP